MRRNQEKIHQDRLPPSGTDNPDLASHVPHADDTHFLDLHLKFSFLPARCQYIRFIAVLGLKPTYQQFLNFSISTFLFEIGNAKRRSGINGWNRVGPSIWTLSHARMWLSDWFRSMAWTLFEIAPDLTRHVLPKGYRGSTPMKMGALPMGGSSQDGLL